MLLSGQVFIDEVNLRRRVVAGLVLVTEHVREFAGAVDGFSVPVGKSEIGVVAMCANPELLADIGSHVGAGPLLAIRLGQRLSLIHI